MILPSKIIGREEQTEKLLAHIMLVSRVYSRDRRGYGKEYKLKVDPGVVGPSVSEEFYDSQVKGRAEVDRLREYQKLMKSRGRSNLANMYSGLLKDF